MRSWSGAARLPKRSEPYAHEDCGHHSVFPARDRHLAKGRKVGVRAELPEDTELWVIIVNDGSPLPAADELSFLMPAERNRLTLLKQVNGGPGRARNRALDLVAATGADYVAFLDSDDVWKPDHLRDAIVALEAGFDFYFCDHTRFDAETTYSSTINALTQFRNPAVQGYHLLGPVGPVITVSNDLVLAASLKAYLSQTSTVVLRQFRVQTLRFDPELHSAGEDHLFWIMVVANGARARCLGVQTSPAVEASTCFSAHLTLAL